jgi:hypothetical protein
MRAASASGDGVAAWVAECRRAGEAATLAAVAAAATRWFAGFVRVLGWPLPDDLTLLNVARDAAHPATPAWRPPSAPSVTVAGGADARLGRATAAGRFALVVHRPSSGADDGVWARATVEAAAGALVRGIAPEAIVVSAGDTGERARVVVDDALLAAGGRMVVEVVRQRVIALDHGFDPADATPSAGCRWCERLAGCPAGQAWLSTQGRWRGGLPVTVS